MRGRNSTTTRCIKRVTSEPYTTQKSARAELHCQSFTSLLRRTNSNGTSNKKGARRAKPPDHLHHHVGVLGLRLERVHGRRWSRSGLGDSGRLCERVLGDLKEDASKKTLNRKRYPLYQREDNSDRTLSEGDALAFYQHHPFGQYQAELE